MGNGSSKYSSRHYDYRPFTGPVIPPPSQMTHANSYASGSTLPSYDMPRRRKRRWYQFGTGGDRHRGQDVWYSAYVSPRGQQPPTPNPFAAYQRPPDHQRTPSMPVPVTAQYGNLHIPEGYMPPTFSQPVIPQDMTSSTTDSGYWRRQALSQHHRNPSQSHYRRPSQSHPPVQPVNPAAMPAPAFPEPITSTQTSSFSSPPFKPFEPFPETRRPGPPMPPPKLMELPPYRDTLSYLSHPSPTSRSMALEILQNEDRRDIRKAREEWRRQDEERERAIREKKEQRERLIDGAGTIRAPAMQTVTALVVDPTVIPQPPPPPKKKPFWRKLFQSSKHDHVKQRSFAKQPASANGTVIVPIHPQQVLPAIPGVVVPMEEPSQSHTTSSSLTYRSPQRVVQPTPTPAVIPVSPGRSYTSGVIPGAVRPQAAMPSPFLYPAVRSTTPETPPPPAAFFSFPAPAGV